MRIHALRESLYRGSSADHLRIIACPRFSCVGGENRGRIAVGNWCAKVREVATVVLVAVNIYSGLESLVRGNKRSFENPPSKSLFKANRLPRHAEPHLRYDALCGEVLAPKARTLGESCMTADIHREEREK
jgi:hypothetical protein